MKVRRGITKGEVVGIIGAGKSVGVTHLSVWMANYLWGARRKTVAVLEWNDHGSFGCMGMFCGKETKSFAIAGVDYYEQAGPQELARCLEKEYSYIIVDFGNITEDSLWECARCDRKIVVGACTEWQADAFLETVGRSRKKDKNWNYAAVFGSEEVRREMEKVFHIKVWRIPLRTDPFVVTAADMQFFEGFCCSPRGGRKYEMERIFKKTGKRKRAKQEDIH